MEVKAGTAAELFTKAAQVHGKRVGFGTRLKSRLWKPTTFGEVYDEGAALDVEHARSALAYFHREMITNLTPF